MLEQTVQIVSNERDTDSYFRLVLRAPQIAPMLKAVGKIATVSTKQIRVLNPTRISALNAAAVVPARPSKLFCPEETRRFRGGNGRENAE